MRVGLNNKQKLFLSLFLCVVLVGSFIFIMKVTLWSNINSLKSSNRDLKSQYDTLVVYVNNEEQYRQDAIKNNEVVMEIANNFEGDMNKKQLLSKFDDLFDDYNIKSTSLSLSENIEVDSVSVLDPDTNEYKDFIYQMTPIDVSYSMAYDSFKKFTRDLKDKNIKISIEDITISPDVTTNKITGVMKLNWATIKGNKEFKDPVYTNPVGINSIFNGLTY